MKKKSAPHIYLKNKGAIDLFFEFLDLPDRKNLLKDIQSGEEIKLPDFNEINDVYVHNNIKYFDEHDLDSNDEQFIINFVNSKHAPKHPILTYNEKKHEYALKSKYDLEKMIEDIVKRK